LEIHFADILNNNQKPGENKTIILNMKAILFNKKAKPAKLMYSETTKPKPNENEVLIKIYAASVNAADYRSLNMGIIPKKKIFGADISGVVESVGSNIQLLKPGDAVVGDLSDYGFGGFAEYAVAPEKFLVKKPEILSFEEAAAIPLAATTALQALRNKGNIQRGQNVLIIGSGGGVGTFAVQLAKYFGATTTAVCSSKNIEQSKILGADYTVDYTSEDLFQTKKYYDLIVAVNGDYSLLRCKKLLTPNGIYVMAGGSLAQILKTIIFGKFLSTGKKKIRFLAAKPGKEDLELIITLAANKTIRPVIDRIFPLENTVDAFWYLNQGHASGKVIIRLQ
jgi:NADPH:quinone reductase-like Zn-dependent oxidoreductase